MRKITEVLIVLLGALIVAAGFNLFLVPHRLLSGGVSGIAMVIGYFIGGNIGWLYFLLNLPLLLWGWFAVGRRFVLLSIVSVIATSWFLQLLPVIPAAEDPLLCAVFGGVVVGVGTGLSLRFGGSTGGFDIIGSILTRNRDFPLGMLLFGLNGLVLLVQGFLLDWDLALCSMLSIYIAGKVIDLIYVRHVKITAFIVTSEPQRLANKLLALPRGVTLIRTSGAYTFAERTMLMTVTTRYELAELRKTIRELDPKAFVNIVETTEVIGEFRRAGTT